MKSVEFPEKESSEDKDETKRKKLSKPLPFFKHPELKAGSKELPVLLPMPRPEELRINRASEEEGDAAEIGSEDVAHPRPDINSEEAEDFASAVEAEFSPVVPTLDEKAESEQEFQAVTASAQSIADERKEFDTMVSREMDADFIAAASGKHLGFTMEDLDRLPAQPPPTDRLFRPTVAFEFVAPPEAPAPAQYYNSPPPALGYFEKAATPGGEPSPVSRQEWARTAANVAEVAANVSRLSELLDPHTAAAKFITTAVIREFLGRGRVGSPAQPERFSGPLPRPESPTVEAPEQEIFDLEGNKIFLKPGERIVRDGAYSAVVDKHNHVVHNAIRYGEAFKQEQRREQLSDDVFAAVDSGQSVGGGMGNGPGALSQSPGWQASPPQDIGYGQSQPQADLRHRLSKPRDQLKSTLLSPWLWTAVAILIIVYFIAALA